MLLSTDGVKWTLLRRRMTRESWRACIEQELSVSRNIMITKSHTYSIIEPSKAVMYTQMTTMKDGLGKGAEKMAAFLFEGLSIQHEQ